MGGKFPTQPAGKDAETAKLYQRSTGWLGWWPLFKCGALMVTGAMMVAALFYLLGSWSWIAAGATTAVVLGWLLFRGENNSLGGRHRRNRVIGEISDSLPVMVFQCRFLLDNRCILTYSNSAIRWIYELEYRDVKKDCSPIFDLIHPDDRDLVQKSFMESALNLTPWVSEHRVILPRQGQRWRFIHARVERLLDGSTLWNGFVMDNTAQKEAHEILLQASEREAAALRATHQAEQKKLRLLARLNEKLHREATHDHLTGVYLRRYFDLQYEEMFDQSRNDAMTVILCDIDHFKGYNDTFGHLAGDQALSTVARTLNDHINRKDQFLARYGGEEFVAVLPGLGSDRAGIVAEELRHSIEALGIRAHDQGVVTISIGVACADTIPPGLTAKDFLQSADEALYAAKDAGRNRVCIRRGDTPRSFRSVNLGQGGRVEGYLFDGHQL